MYCIRKTFSIVLYVYLMFLFRFLKNIKKYFFSKVNGTTLPCLFIFSCLPQHNLLQIIISCSFCNIFVPNISLYVQFTLLKLWEYIICIFVSSGKQ